MKGEQERVGRVDTVKPPPTPENDTRSPLERMTDLTRAILNVPKSEVEAAQQRRKPA